MDIWNIWNLPRRPLFRLDLSVHVNKIPIHLLTQSLQVIVSDVEIHIKRDNRLTVGAG